MSVPEVSPVIAARGAAVPTSLPTIFEVFSSAVLAVGSLLSPPPPPPGRGKDSHSASVCLAGRWTSSWHRGWTSPVYPQTDGERPLGDTRPFWVTEMIENR